VEQRASLMKMVTGVVTKMKVVVTKTELDPMEVIELRKWCVQMSMDCYINDEGENTIACAKNLFAYLTEGDKDNG